MELDLEHVFDDCWRELENGISKRKHEFHTGTLATLGERGAVARTVVLRLVNRNERLLHCHTDSRSEKVSEITADPRVGFLFYAPSLKIQLRAEGLARIHHQDDIARSAWEQTHLESRRAYASIPGPGVKIDHPSSGLPEHLLDRTPTLEESEPSYAHFAVVHCEVHRLDWMLLTSHGHLRARFEWNDGVWDRSWVTP